MTMLGKRAIAIPAMLRAIPDDPHPDCPTHRAAVPPTPTIPHTDDRTHARLVDAADSTMSTRVLYGNFTFRPPFPAPRPAADVGEIDLNALNPGVWGADTIRSCRKPPPGERL